MRLIKTVTVMRHGIRRSFSGRHPGQITGRGLKLCRQMGRWMYSEILRMAPDADISLKTASSPSQRAIDSAKEYASGFMPYSEAVQQAEGWTAEMFIPVLTGMSEQFRAEAEQQILNNTGIHDLKDIPNQFLEGLSLLKQKTGDDLKRYAQETELVLTDGDGPVIHGLPRIASAKADELLTREITSLMRSCHLKDAERKILSEITDMYLNMLFGTDLIIHSALGPFLTQLGRELISGMDEHVLLCGHDTTVKTVQTALGIDDYDLPGNSFGKIPPGCCMRFDVYSDTEEQRYVRIVMIYPSDDHLYGRIPIKTEYPPGRTILTIKNLPPYKNGLYRVEDIL